jgi:hypothetical protein
MIFKVDFHKAFHSVSWNYLDEIMGYMGLGAKWRSLIYTCMHVSLLLNYEFLLTGLLLESSRSHVEFIKVIRYLHSC